MIERVTSIFTREEQAYEAIVSSFWKEGNIDGTFQFQEFRQRWNIMSMNSQAALWKSTVDDLITGLIGVIGYEDLLTNETRAIVPFWYVVPAFRASSQGIRLFMETAPWLEAHRTRRLIMAGRDCMNGVRMDKFYEEHGFKKVETHYMKELVWK